MFSQSHKFSLLQNVFFCIILISCSDDNDSNISDVEDPKVIIHEEMVSKGLFKSDELSVFIDNLNLAESNLLLNKRTVYDSELNETTTVISITSRTELIDNVSIIEYILRKSLQVPMI